MEYRTLGKTGITVSEIGFGAWAIGGDAWGPVEDRTSIEALERAIDLGITFIDTADVYGDGRSESVVAPVLKGRRDQLVISTKGGLMGHHRDPKKGAVYDEPSKVVAACEASLRRLQTDYIDVYFCHIWWDNDQETEAFLAAFEQLKREGKVRAAGVSTDGIEHIKHYNQHGTLDVIQIDYSILNRGPEKEIFPYVQEHEIGVVARGPLKMGLLTGKFSRQSTFPDGDIRHNWPKEEWFGKSLAQVDELRTLERGDQTLGQLALRFVLSHPAVSVAIPGAKTPAQVEQNAAASRRPLISADDLEQIQEVALAPA